ncbi:hypothetical protein F2Q69_00028799 [Brassica cretica]|uniref:Uncharacterized protein n=1 Tax=Brassica cretica TaxID=69181 RepID=A0A8S9S8T2_BRACR|nr:hypothetical protein F2Q69_00028799 [Brassica cretica]
MMSFGGSQWCRSTPDLEHRSTYTSPYQSTGTSEHRSRMPTESTASFNAVKILTHEEFAAKHPHPPSPDKVRIARRADTSIDRHRESSTHRHSEAAIDRQPPAPIDRRAPITYRVQMPKIDVALLNALRLKHKPSEYPPEAVRTPSDDGKDPMVEDRVPTGRTLRRRKEKVAKHLMRGANDKEKESFLKRVFRIPIDKPFEDAYYTHKLKMRMRITLKKKSDPGQFAIPCTVKGIEFPHALCDTRASISLPRVMADHLGLQVEPSQELFTFVDCSEKNYGGILCLTLIDPNAHYDHVSVTTPHTISRRINDPGIIAACHCGEDYETDYLASIETHTASLIDNDHQKLTDIPHDESVNSRPDDWENDYYNPAIAAYTRQYMHTYKYNEDYEEERTTEYRVILDEEDKLLQHSSWKRNAPSIDMTSWASIDTQPHQRYQKRASTDTAYYKSIDTAVNHAQEGDYSIGSWADEHHDESFAVETAIYAPRVENLQDSFIDEGLLNMDPDGYAKAIDGRTLHFSREDIADILQTINGADNLFMHQRNNPEQKKATKEFYDTAGGIDNIFIQKSRHPTQTSIDVAVPTSVARQPEFGRRAYDLYGSRKLYLEEKDENIRRLLERASRDEPSYICLHEHANLFTQTKLLPEIYTKDEITEMFYGVCGEDEKNKEAFQMKLDGVYYPLNDSFSWLTTCMEKMKQDIARIQHATDVARPPSIDRRRPPSIDRQHHTSINNHMSASINDKERLDGRCDDIYFPLDLSISALTSKIEAIQRELVEIQSYIARRPEASLSIDRRNNISTDIHHQTSVDDATNRGRLVPKTT